MIPLNGIVFGGSGASRNVKLTPSLNQSGTTTITVTVSDGVLSASDSFEVTVNAINDKPVISGVLDQVTSENTATDPVAFTISDIETAAGSLTLTKQTSNSAVVPLSGILLSGTGGSRTVAIQPASNAGGSSMITLTVSDGSLSESITFKVTVIDTHNPADLLWNGGNENWNFTAANWHFVSENGSVNTAWSDSNRAVFSGTAGTVNLTANVKASRLDFLSNYIVQGTGGLTVDPGVGAAQAVVSVGSSVSAKLGSRLLGTSDLVKSGPGMLVLDGNNTFSGHLKIEQGIIQASQDSALGQGGAASDTGTQIIAGASLEITGSSRLGENLRMAGDGTDGSGAVLSVSGVNAIEEKIALDGDATVGVTAGSLDISGILYQDTGTRNLSKRGAGTLILSGVNTYNGTTTVTAGILRAKNSKALGTGGFTSQTLTSIAPGAAVELEGGYQWDEHFHIAGGGVGGVGAIRNISGINVLLNNIALKADATLGVAAGSLEVKGALYEESGSRGLAKAGSGLLILSGGNSYSGVTRVNLGTLRARHISALGAGGFSAQTLTMVAPGAALEFEGSLVVDEHIHFAGTGISGLGALRSLTGVNALTNNIAMDGDASVYVETGSLEMRGVVYQDTGTPLFRKTGPALLVFTGDNGISGVTEVAGGTLRVKHNHALGTGGFDLQTLTRVLGGAALELEGSISIDEHLHVAGSGPTTRGVIRNITGSNTVTGNIALDADSNVDVPGGSLNLPGIIYQETGAFGLGKWGVGKLTLAGGNSYGGITAIHEGTVRVMHNNGLGVGGFDGATLTNVSSGATLEFEGNLTVPEHTHIAGTGVEGTGALRVVQGTVVLTNHCALDARATIQVAAGASLTQATSFYSDVAAGVGFVKTGGGILRIDGGADVHGAISVQGGTLALGTATMNDAYGLSLSAGAHVNLLFSGDDTIASLTLGSDTLPPGRYNAASHPAWISGNGTLVVPGGSAYQTWIAGFPGVAVESRGPLDDPDGDSILNIVEFVLGGQPGLRDRNLVSAALIDTNGDGVKESLFSVAVPAGAVFNLQGESLMATWHSLGITVQGSQNLSAWSVPVLEVQPAVVPPGAHSLPAGYVWKSFRLGSAGALPKGFMRVLVTF